MFTRNLANWDRWLRITAGAGICGGAFLLPFDLWAQAAVALSGLGLAMTGMAARCPVCKISGVSTYRC